VVEYRDSLQQLWNGTSANQARAVRSCVSGAAARSQRHRALRDFAQGLPAYAAG